MTGTAAVPGDVVTWSSKDAEGRITSLLVVGPGPFPLSHETWPRIVVLGEPEPDGWAIVNLPALGPLPATLADRLHRATAEASASAGGEDAGRHGAIGGAVLDQSLFEECYAAALGLVADRLHEEVVAGDPRGSGLSLARIRAATAELELEFAPASAAAFPDGATLPALGWKRLRFGLKAGEAEPLWCANEVDEADAELEFDETAVALVAAGGSARLPCARSAFRLHLGEGSPAIGYDGALEVTAPSSASPLVLARLEHEIAGVSGADDAVVCATLAASPPPT